MTDLYNTSPSISIRPITEAGDVFAGLQLREHRLKGLYSSVAEAERAEQLIEGLIAERKTMPNDLLNGNCELLGAYLGSGDTPQLIGFAALQSGIGVREVKTIVVAERLRRHGAGSRLLDACIKKAAPSADLFVDLTPEAASQRKSFFTRVGFTIDAKHTDTTNTRLVLPAQNY